MRYVFVEKVTFWSIREVFDRLPPEWYRTSDLDAELDGGYGRFKRLINDFPNGPLDWEIPDHASCRVLYAYVPDREPRFVEAIVVIAELLEELGPRWVFEAETDSDPKVFLFLWQGMLHFCDTKHARRFVKSVGSSNMHEQPSILRSDYPSKSEFDGLVRPNRYERLVSPHLSWIKNLGFEPGIMYGAKLNSRDAYKLDWDLRLDDCYGTTCVSAYGIELGFNDHGSQGARLFWMTDNLKLMLVHLESMGFKGELLKRPGSKYTNGVLSFGLTVYLVRGLALEFCLWGYGDPENVERSASSLRGLGDGFWALDDGQIDPKLHAHPGILFGEVRMASPQPALMEMDLVKLGFRLIGESSEGLSRWFCDGRIVVELRADSASGQLVPVFVADSLEDPAKLGAELRAKPIVVPNKNTSHEADFDWDFGKAIVRTRAGVESLRLLG
jgi:hypothetical protein